MIPNSFNRAAKNANNAASAAEGMPEPKRQANIPLAYFVTSRITQGAAFQPCRNHRAMSAASGP
jgi:hypothetical protein